MRYELHDFQADANAATFMHFKSGKKGNPLIVAPTGSGKSVMIGDFCREVIERWPAQNILVLTHDVEIIQQDYASIVRQMESDEIVDIYSAGLFRKEIKQVTVAGIQSVYDKPELFMHFNIILLDEAHAVSYDENSRYRRFLNAVKKPVIGYTATPFRLGTGYLHLGEDAFFSDIAYTIKVKTLQDAGKLCQITCKDPAIKLDASQIKKQAGDFIISELSLAFDREAITTEIVKDLLNYKDTRKKWMVYAIDIDHCEHVAETLNNHGIKAIALHSKSGNRKATLDLFRYGDYQAIVSVAMLTTGVDIPEVDLIALLRPTSSPVLHVQIIGRGMRVAEGKENCLIRDYAGNLLRNGPIDAPVIKIAGKGGGEAIMKVCEGCDEIVPIATRICKFCGAEFIFQHHLNIEAGDAAIIAMVNWHKVTAIQYDRYVGKRQGIPMLRVKYICGLREFNEHVCLEHGGRARGMAAWWWKRRSDEDPPLTAAGGVLLSDSISPALEIMVDETKSYPKIIEHKF